MQIIAHLRLNARMGLTQMSRKTSIPVSTIFDKLKTYEKNIIQKHTSLIDFSKLGYNTRANITLKTNKQNREKLKEFLQKHQNINSVYKINNGYDYLIEAVFRHIKELEDFLEMLEEKFDATERKVYYIIEDIKREGFMSNTNPFFMTTINN